MCPHLGQSNTMRPEFRSYGKQLLTPASVHYFVRYVKCILDLSKFKYIYILHWILIYLNFNKFKIIFMK
jgi:hypothetical protein